MLAADSDPTISLQDDFNKYEQSPPQPGNLYLVSKLNVKSTGGGGGGVGIMDDELQATFDDPLHLVIPSPTWEEMERLEKDRLAKLSSSSASDGSLSHIEGIESTGTHKGKH
jgi:hypothetical protein